jgi:hypothetical protein
MVWSAAVVLAGVAVLGLYLGIRRGPSGPGDFSETTVVAGAAGHPVRAAAEPAPPLPAMDETQVRQIARQEAQALLTHPHSAAKRSKEDDGGDDTGAPDQSDNGSVPSDQSAAPAATASTPAPPPPPANTGPPD